MVVLLVGLALLVSGWIGSVISKFIYDRRSIFELAEEMRPGSYRILQKLRYFNTHYLLAHDFKLPKPKVYRWRGEPLDSNGKPLAEGINVDAVRGENGLVLLPRSESKQGQRS